MHRLVRFTLPLLLVAALPAHAADLRVTTFADEDDGQCTPSHCSLREAISHANQTPGDTFIRLAAGEYLLERANPDTGYDWPIEEDDNRIGDFDVHGQVTLVGRGIGVTRLNAQHLDRLFHVHPDAQLRMTGLTLTGGLQIFDGGALLNHGKTAVREVAFVDNLLISYMPYPAERTGSGGAVANFGVFEAQRATFRGNRLDASETATPGKGGGVYNQGSLLLRDSLFVANRANDYNESGMGGALYNLGDADIARTSFQANQVSWGGYGAAIANVGRITLSNSTLSGNFSVEQSAFENGHPWLPELSAKAQARLYHVTIAGNEGRGISNRGDLLLRNSIIAGNRASEFEEVRNCINRPGAIGYQARGLLLGSDAGGCVADTIIADDTTFTHHLFLLQENNGSQVHPLRRNSAAIDAGVGGCASHDQRGLDRLRDGNGDGIVNCDLGAFERAYP
ncbi:CSLREA domain-containing protein [Pseudomonas mangrovi]|uniref:CSLREA domain-containing protein n=1 Tax=Pseudomonas mangrovi TaxID=2161748 RepID=A0A2T5PDC8_9PSED|nr:CSLREA domain-containing protein [Pseudomonas mangrovi]PTU75746.1 hypothetical protein DBO85_03485 [Pseudomonas mangrovi]